MPVTAKEARRSGSSPSRRARTSAETSGPCRGKSRCSLPTSASRQRTTPQRTRSEAPTRLRPRGAACFVASRGVRLRACTHGRARPIRQTPTTSMSLPADTRGWVSGTTTVTAPHLRVVSNGAEPARGATSSRPLSVTDTPGSPWAHAGSVTWLASPAVSPAAQTSGRSGRTIGPYDVRLGTTAPRRTPSGATQMGAPASPAATPAA